MAINTCAGFPTFKSEHKYRLLSIAHRQIMFKMLYTLPFETTN